MYYETLALKRAFKRLNLNGLEAFLQRQPKLESERINFAGVRRAVG